MAGPTINPFGPQQIHKRSTPYQVHTGEYRPVGMGSTGSIINIQNNYYGNAGRLWDANCWANREIPSDSGGSFLGNLWKGAKNLPVVGGIFQGVEDIGKGVWNGVKDIGGGVVDGIKNIGKGKILKGIGNIAGGVWNGVKDIGGGVIKGIGNAVKGLFKGW